MLKLRCNRRWAAALVCALVTIRRTSGLKVDEISDLADLTSYVERNEAAVIRGVLQPDSRWDDDGALLELMRAHARATTQHSTTPSASWLSSTTKEKCEDDDTHASFAEATESEPEIPVRWAARQSDLASEGASAGRGHTRFGRRSHELSYDRRNITLARFIDSYTNSTSVETMYAAQLDVAMHLPALPIPPLPVSEALLGPPADTAPVTIYWSGVGAPVTQLHYDSRDNVVCVASGGWKTFRLVDPVQSSALLYSHSDRDGNTSPVPLDDPVRIAAEFPLARFAAVASVTLRPRDCLFLPIYWFHEVESAPTRTISINWWRTPDARRKDIMGKLLCGHTNRKAAKRC